MHSVASSCHYSYYSKSATCIYIALQVILGDTWLPFNLTDIEDGMRTHFNHLAMTHAVPLISINCMYDKINHSCNKTFIAMLMEYK